MIKKGVDITNLQPQMVLAYVIIESYTTEQFSYETVITSGADSVHEIGSLHPSGYALDFRSKHIQAALKIAWMQGIQYHLGDAYDVVLEDVGLDNEHLHVEYDP